MANAIFNAKCTLKTCSATANPDEFDITAQIYDAEGVFTGLDIVVGDMIIADTAGTESGTVSKYKVKTITAKTFNLLTATIKYDDIGTAIDPTGALDVPGFICRPSTTNKLLWISANDTQQFAQKLVTFANNIQQFQIVESGLSSGTANKMQDSFVNGTGALVNNFSATYIKNDNTFDLCDADIAAQGECFGIVDNGSNVAIGALGAITYTGKVAGALTGLGFAPGDKIYVGQTPGELTNITPGDPGDTVFLVGRCAGATGADLYLEKKLITVI